MRFVKLEWMTKTEYMVVAESEIFVYRKSDGTHIIVGDCRPGNSFYAWEVEKPTPLYFTPVPYDRQFHSHGKVCVIAANSTPEIPFMIEPGVVVIKEYKHGLI